MMLNIFLSIAPSYLVVEHREPVGVDCLLLLEPAMECVEDVLHGEDAHSRARDGVRRCGEDGVHQRVGCASVNARYHVAGRL